MITLEQTSQVAPEAYVVKIDDKVAGYVRYLFGEFTVVDTSAKMLLRHVSSDDYESIIPEMVRAQWLEEAKRCFE